MSPRNAVIIVLILFLIIVGVFVFLYLNNKQAAEQANKQPAGSGSTSQGKLSPEQQKIKAIEDKTNQQVEQIVEQGKTATGGITKQAAIKLEETINQAIIEEAKLKTPEQIEMDKQKQVEKDKLEQQINQQIKNQSPK